MSSLHNAHVAAKWDSAANLYRRVYASQDVIDWVQGKADSERSNAAAYAAVYGERTTSFPKFCPPPAVNAAGLLEGSPVAGQGVDTHSVDWQLVQLMNSGARMCRAQAKFLRSQRDIAGAMRREAQARDCEAFLRRYADSLLSNGSLF